MLLMRHNEPPELGDRQEGVFLFFCNPGAVSVAGQIRVIQ
jgi:hypothetical protein